MKNVTAALSENDLRRALGSIGYLLDLMMILKFFLSNARWMSLATTVLLSTLSDEYINAVQTLSKYAEVAGRPRLRVIDTIQSQTIQTSALASARVHAQTCSDVETAAGPRVTYPHWKSQTVYERAPSSILVDSWAGFSTGRSRRGAHIHFDQF